MAGGKEPEEYDYVVLRSNRRKNLRKQLLVLKVKGEDRGGVFFGYAKTIGWGGMFISTVSPRKVGEEFEISFKTPGDGAEARCRCVVAWQRGFDPKFKEEPGMGIRFINLDVEVRAKIEEWVNKQ
jgi:uncharacterized protein (TIGR02266 family)